MTVLPAYPATAALDPARTVAIPRQVGGAHRAHRAPERPSAPTLTPVRVRHAAAPVARPRVSPVVRGAGAAAYAVVARAGSLTTLAAMLVLGGAMAAATDGTPAPQGATVTTLQGP